MSLSILYCGDCRSILAASPDLGLGAECLTHAVDGALHRGYRALRLPDVDADVSQLRDLEMLAKAYPKESFDPQLEPLAGVCS